MVQEGSADLGLVEAAIDDPTLVMAPVAEDELILVVPPTHPWAARTPRSAQELKSGPWVLREPGSGTRSVFEGALPGLGLTSKDLKVALVLPSNEAVRAAVEAGAGVTVISRLVVASSIKAGNLVPVKFPLLHRCFFALRHKERYVSRAEQAFLDVISNDAAPNRKQRRASPEASVSQSEIFTPLQRLQKLGHRFGVAGRRREPPAGFFLHGQALPRSPSITREKLSRTALSQPCAR